MTNSNLSPSARLVAWFNTHYEDAAHNVFYNGSEGGYQYAPGAGPVDPKETLLEEFPKVKSDVLAKAVNELLSEAGAWVKKSQY